MPSPTLAARTDCPVLSGRGSVGWWYVENEKWWRAIKERSAEFKAYYENQYGTR